MKYLKFFETTIKHSDPIAVNHPLRDFSRRLEDILIEIKKFDNYDKLSTVRRYFNDDGKIHINYNNNYRGRLIKILLQVINDDVIMDIYCYKPTKKDEINTSLEFFQFSENNLSDFNVFKGGRIPHLQLHFSLDEQNTIINSLDYFPTSKRYNL